MKVPQKCPGRIQIRNQLPSGIRIHNSGSQIQESGSGSERNIYRFATLKETHSKIQILNNLECRTNLVGTGTILSSVSLHPSTTFFFTSESPSRPPTHFHSPFFSLHYGVWNQGFTRRIRRELWWLIWRIIAYCTCSLTYVALRSQREESW